MFCFIPDFPLVHISRYIYSFWLLCCDYLFRDWTFSAFTTISHTPHSFLWIVESDTWAPHLIILFQQSLGILLLLNSSFILLPVVFSSPQKGKSSQDFIKIIAGWFIWSMNRAFPKYSVDKFLEFIMGRIDLYLHNK